MNKKQWRWEKYSSEEIATLLSSVLPDLAYVARLKGFGNLAAKLDVALKELPPIAATSNTASSNTLKGDADTPS